LFKYYFGGKGEDSVSYVYMFLKQGQQQGDFDFLCKTYKEEKNIFARTEKTHILGNDTSRKASLEREVTSTKQLKIVTPGHYLLNATKEALSSVCKSSMSFLKKYMDASSSSPKVSTGTTSG
jgi:hypothetical protein